MAVSTVEIEKFLVFKDKFSADFCYGINVFTGANGSGKTTLMKAMYAACKYTFNDPPKTIIWTELLDRYFDSREDIVSDSGTVHVNFKNSSQNRKVGDVRFAINKLHVPLVEWTPGFNAQAIYIPPEDMLSHSKGFLALTNERKMPFDQTQIDILSKASIPETNNITPNAEKVIDRIKTIIGGDILYENDTFYIKKESGEKVSFSFEASGFRKFGLLLKLLRNGLLENGTTLFWDEPENSLNPEILPDLVNILLELQKNGVQIFVATHSYALARWFELNATKENTLKYFSMRKTNNGIEYDTADTYLNLNQSVLENAGDELFNAVARNGMGVNG